MEQGRAYRFNHPEHLQSILHIHRLYRTTHGARPQFSEFKILSADEDPEALLLFGEWDQCGKEADAETLLLDPRCHPIEEEWQIDCPQFDPARGARRQQDAKTVKVEWGCSRSEMELRYLRNVARCVSMTADDIERLSRPWTVHEYNCGMGENTAALLQQGLSVEIGVEQEDMLGKTWLVFLPSDRADGQAINKDGELYTGSLEEFLLRYKEKEDLSELVSRREGRKYVPRHPTLVVASYRGPPSL